MPTKQWQLRCRQGHGCLWLINHTANIRVSSSNGKRENHRDDPLPQKYGRSNFCQCDNSNDCFCPIAPCFCRALYATRKYTKPIATESIFCWFWLNGTVFSSVSCCRVFDKKEGQVWLISRPV